MVKIIINFWVMMVTLKNNIIPLRETKWRHGAAARNETVLAAEWFNVRRKPRVKFFKWGKKSEYDIFLFFLLGLGM